MSSGAGFPFTLNGNTYTQDMFAPWAYPANFPRAMNDLGAVGAQVAADRVAIKAALDANGNLLIPATQARLGYTSPTQLTLSPVNGGFLWINGLNRPVTSPVLSNAGLTAGTLYFVYAFMSGTTMTLEASTTGHVLGAAGVRVKSGDATRTLVGMAYTDAGTPGLFADSGAKRLVASFYHRGARPLTGPYDAGSTTSMTAVELNTNYRVTCVTWADSLLDFSAIGAVRNNTLNQGQYGYVGLDGNNAGAFTVSVSNPAGASQVNAPRFVGTASEGYHTLSVRGAVSGGTGTWEVSIIGSVG